MAEMKHYLAVDLGASSGRTVVASFDGEKITLKEMNRFWNGPNMVGGTFYWDFIHLFRNIKEGISLARREFGNALVSMGVDTWGVDYGLLDEQGKLLGNPVNYRDSRTNGMFEEAFARVPKEKIFEKSGLQFMELNTLYQLLAETLTDSFQFKSAKTLLLVPDLLNYWLTGEISAERTFASTTQFYNPVTKDWAKDMLEEMGIRTDLLPEIKSPGQVLGKLQNCVGEETGAYDLPVVLVGSHDTASAFAAVPVAEGEHCAFLSSGTWSLFGTELPEPVINDDVLAANFTNEIGVCDTVRFLKNLSGLWIIQEIRRTWKDQGNDYAWDEMDRMALEAEPFKFFIDPSHTDFIAPGDMPKRIQDYCERTGQGRPETPGEILRTAVEGLALLYANVYEDLEKLSGRKLDVLRIVGGGCKNVMLDQFAANATGRKVVTGPIEATATGNILMQMLAMGDIKSLAEGREILRNSFADEMQTFEPQDVEQWQAGLAKWREVTAKG